MELPGPIPNPEVKCGCADGTHDKVGRVGSCHDNCTHRFSSIFDDLLGFPGSGLGAVHLHSNPNTSPVQTFASHSKIQRKSKNFSSFLFIFEDCTLCTSAKMSKQLNCSFLKSVLCRRVAQLVEQRIPNPTVGGSIPLAPAKRICFIRV